MLADAVPDGERLLTCRQLYDLAELPGELIIVGSGVTGAEFASAYQALGSQVTLVSSREHVLPNEDTDAAMVVEDVFRRRGMTVLGRSRAVSAKRTAAASKSCCSRRQDRARVALPADRRHGAVHRRHRAGRGRRGPRRTRLHHGRPGVADLGARRLRGRRLHRRAGCSPRSRPCRAGSRCGTRSARPSSRCGSATWRPRSSPSRRSPRSASARQTWTAGAVGARVVKLPLATNARAKMDGFSDGFVKLFTRRNTGIVLGGVIVAPRASELILGVSLAVEQQLTVDEIAHTFAVYPSLTGSVTEAARQLMQPLEPR